ncbi:hypothetical protein N748_08760 [Legionella pneumophila str. 121004]|nr:hypothetical protein N748_08760 [Legionella pneumophila str. 121004]ERH44111.1 hypothetical protein N751_14760 [Legionella pneumophila str. Leg01/11]ERH46162.1 hypothetical protein N750_05595 [Legionella pneumophila str. Leg01/53]
MFLISAPGNGEEPPNLRMPANKQASKVVAL